MFSSHGLETDSWRVLPVLPKGTFLWRKEGSWADSGAASKHPPVLWSWEGKWRGSPEDDVTALELAIAEGNGAVKGHPGVMFVRLHSIYIKHGVRLLPRKGLVLVKEIDYLVTFVHSFL